MQHAHPFHPQMGHVGAQIVEQRLPVGEYRPRRHVVAQHPQGGGLHDLDRRDAGVAHARHAGDRLPVGRHQAANAAKFAQQQFGQRLGVAARDGERQQIFDQFMIQQRLAARISQFLPQPGAVSGPVMRGFRILFGQIPVP